MTYLTDQEVNWLARDLLKNESERDKQHLIGPSEVGNPCDRCLAERLLNRQPGRSRFWMGARIGTAIHVAMEEQEALYVDGTEDYKFKALKGAKIEEKIFVGSIEGYGNVHGHVDLALTEHAHLIDWKTTTRTKLKKYKLDGVSTQYYYQQQLYAWGLNKADIKIDRISLVFVCRDGATDEDIWVYSFDYDESAALKAWTRLDKIWQWLRNGGDPSELRSDTSCYTCQSLGRV